MGIVAELRVQGQDAERTEAELGAAGGANSAKDSTHPSWRDTEGTGESCGGWGKRAPRTALIPAGREKESLCWS